MRYDTLVSFWKENSHYDPDQGKDVAEPKLVAAMYSNVTDVGIDRSVQVLGSLTQRAIVVRLLDVPPVSWSYATLGMDNVTHYRLTTSREPLHGHTLILGEDVVHE